MTTYDFSAARARKGRRTNTAGNLKETKAVVLAGGRGTRLAPYTSVLPKPLMPVGDRAILEIVVEQLEEAGVVDVHFCVGYLSHLIQAVFDNRENGHVNINYVREQDALGTAAPLRLVDGLDETFLVMNGDVLTTLDYRDLVRYHREHGNMLTIATHHRAIKIDYGMLHLDVASRVREYEEKPELVSPVSMGIYVMEPDVLPYIPENSYFDFPDLVRTLLDDGQPVGAYRYEGAWFDIGRQEDYAQAVEAWQAHTEADLLATLEGRAHESVSADESDAVRSTANGNGANGNGRSAGRRVSRRQPEVKGVNLEALKKTFSEVPAAVSVVTTYTDDGRPHGTTVSAFCSLSADPPLVMVALDRSSDLLKLLEETGRFGLNVLAADQEDVGRACAQKWPDKFNGIAWRDDRDLPRIDGASAWLACEVEDLLPGGDHLIVVGLVTCSETDGAEPMVYHRRQFLRLA